METTMRSHTPMRPRTIAELLPGIKGLLSKDALHMLTAQKHAPPNTCQTRTNEKNRNLKPMTIAEIRALTGQTPKKYSHPTTSTKSKPWNSSVKVDKTKPLTKDGRMKHSTVRKELNFQLKPKAAASNRTTMATFVAKKIIPPQATARENATSRISGVYKILETPVFNKPKPANILPQKVPIVKKNNISFKSNSDDSFVQREKEINDFEEKCNALTEEPTLENIAEISPPVSTPFKDYRNVRDYFNQSEAENSVLWNDNTILSFEKPLESKNSKREESVIVSLCEMLNKATVTNPNNNILELDELIEVERQTENQLKMIENVIEMLNSMKEKQLKNLQHIRNLKRQVEKENKMTLVHNENTTNMAIEKIATTAKEYIADNMAKENKVKIENVTPEKSPVTSRATVIKSKSPSYKIPKKNLCLRKKVFYKSMPNVSDGLQTPIKRNDTALSMYLQIKEQMTFLNTPTAKPRSEIPDTPAITSNNLQKQLDKLYNN